ncbi:MAG: aminopeptidase P family protein, partial [Dehalococcoidia bacterium]|nr:aminopeptidase P family protein [Dehalococcoidia bacterium]
FTGSAGYLIITPCAAILATDSRYVEQAERQAPGFELRQIAGEAATWLPQVLLELGIQELVFEADDLRVSQYDQIKDIFARLGTKLISSRGLVEKLRALKEPEEVELITQAASLADAAMEHAARVLKPGLSELDLGWEIESYLRSHGSEALPFEVIAAAGPNAALPHAHPSERPIGPGEPVVIDIGACIGGYASDLTRTLCAGRPTAELKKIYALVLRAQENAEAMISAGTTGSEADGFARSIIAEANYGGHFGHGLGHGLGLLTHEEPRLGPGSQDTLQDNMVFTIEPGIYVPGWGGVRLEDTVVMKNGRITPLSRSRKQLN